MPLREGAPGAGLQIALEIESSSLVRKFEGDVELPWAVARRVGAAAGVVVGEARGDIRGEADVVARLGSGTLQYVDESLVFRHPHVKATSVPTCWITERAETTNTHHTDGSLCDLSSGEGLQEPRCSWLSSGVTAEQKA